MGWLPWGWPTRASQGWLWRNTRWVSQGLWRRAWSVSHGWQGMSAWRASHWSLAWPLRGWPIALGDRWYWGLARSGNCLHEGRAACNYATTWGLCGNHRSLHVSHLIWLWVKSRHHLVELSALYQHRVSRLNGRGFDMTSGVTVVFLSAFRLLIPPTQGEIFGGKIWKLRQLNMHGQAE